MKGTETKIYVMPEQKFINDELVNIISGGLEISRSGDIVSGAVVLVDKYGDVSVNFTNNHRFSLLSGLLILQRQILSESLIDST